MRYYECDGCKKPLLEAEVNILQGIPAWLKSNDLGRNKDKVIETQLELCPNCYYKKLENK